MASGRSATSSRKSVPPLAAWKKPSRSSWAPVKAPFAVAEELAFHQVFRDRAAVHRHEGAGGAGAAAVDQAGAQFLAAAGFAGDVDRRLAARQLFDHGAHLLHARRFADQANQRDSRYPDLPGQAQGRLDQGAQLLQADRLGQVVEGAGLQRPRHCRRCRRR